MGNVAHGTYPKHSRVKDELKSYEWCLNNKIVIGPAPLWAGDWGKWTVEITMNGVTHLDPKTYNGYNAQTKMYEYYKYYYDKSNI